MTTKMLALIPVALATVLLATTSHAVDAPQMPAKCTKSAEQLRSARLDYSRRLIGAIALFPSRWNEGGPAVDDAAWEKMRAAFRGVSAAILAVAPCLKGGDATTALDRIRMVDKVAADSRTGWIAKAKENGGKIRDAAAPMIFGLTILKIVAQRDIEDLLPAFTASWPTIGGAFTMRAGWSSEWQNKLNKLGLGGKYVPLRVDMKNGSKRDIKFNPVVDRFVVITRKGRQFNTIALPDNFTLHRALSTLAAEDRQLLFDEVRTVYSGSQQPMIVLLPAQAAPETWRTAIYENKIGHMHSPLRTKKFKPAPRKARTKKALPKARKRK